MEGSYESIAAQAGRVCNMYLTQATTGGSAEGVQLTVGQAVRWLPWAVRSEMGSALAPLVGGYLFSMQHRKAWAYLASWVGEQSGGPGLSQGKKLPSARTSMNRQQVDYDIARKCIEAEGKAEQAGGGRKGPGVGWRLASQRRAGGSTKQRARLSKQGSLCVDNTGTYEAD